MDKKLLFLILVLFMNLDAEQIKVEPAEKLKKGLLERMVEPKVSLNSSYLSDANVESSKGSVSVFKNTLQLNNAIGGISYTNWSFLWDNLAELPFGNGVDSPIEQMHSVKLNLNIPFFLSDKWFLLTSISANTTFEKEMKDSYGAGMFAFASYKLDEDHSIQLGAFANYHPIASIALPVISYSYRGRKTDGFQLVLGFPRAYVGYFLKSDTLLRGGMIFSQSVIKLSDASSVEEAGYIEAEDYMGNIGIVHDFTSRLTLDTDILYSLKRDFTIYNSAGDEQNSYSIKPSLGISLRLKYIF